MVTRVTAATPKRGLQSAQSATLSAKSAGASRPAFTTRRHREGGFVAIAKSVHVSQRVVIAAASGGESDELKDEENNRRAAEAEVEVVEDDEQVDAEDVEEEEEEEETVPPTRVAEILAQLQLGLDSGNGGEVLGEVLGELTAEVLSIEQDIKTIQAANVTLDAEAGTAKDQYLRLTADFDNFKKRTVKEKQQLGQTAKSNVFGAMLPALDNFDLASRNLKTETEEGAKLMAQYDGLYEGLMTILSNQGLTAVAGVGAPFDPNFHEAIMREESDSPEDEIIEEFRKGYKMGEDTLVRASMVKVSAGPAAETAE